MLGSFHDTNYYEVLLHTTTMRPGYTYKSINKVCEQLINSHLPYDVFKVIWDQLNPVDKIIYHDDVDNTCVDMIYTNYVEKGSFKYSKRKKRRSLKVGKAVRYKFEQDWI